MAEEKKKVIKTVSVKLKGEVEFGGKKRKVDESIDITPAGKKWLEEQGLI